MYSRKSLSIILALILAFQICLPLTALAESETLTPTDALSANASPASAPDLQASGASTPVPITQTKLVTFRYAATDVDRDETCYYNDNFFASPSNVYSPSLATLSISLAMASFGSSDALKAGKLDKQPQNCIDFLQKLGFASVEANELYKQKADLDSIGLVIGYKMIGETPLIAVGVRGGNYTAEWGGNFFMGDVSDTAAAGDHKGFNIAAQTAVDYIKSYLASHSEIPTGNIKLWISGFSRAGATSNLTAAKLIRDGNLGSDYMLARENLYAYTFATPSGGIISNRHNNSYDYSNIYNIFTQHDFVPLVAPNSATFGNFGQYGTNMYLPTRETYSGYADLISRVKPRLTDNKNYALDEFRSYQLALDWPPYSVDETGIRTQSVFYNDFVNILADDVLTSRAGYRASSTNAMSYEDAIRTAVKMLLVDSSLTTKTQAVTLLKTWFSQIFSSWSSGYNFIKAVTSLNVAKLKTILTDTLDAATKKLGAPYTSINANSVITAVPSLVTLVANLGYQNPWGLLTMVADVMNRGGITQAHDPDLMKSWLELMDPVYFPNDAERLDYESIFLCGDYRKVTVAGYVKLTVEQKRANSDSYDAVFELDTEAPSTAANDIISSYINDDETVLFFPANGDYRIKIQSTNKLFSQSAQLSVGEFSPKIEPAEKVQRLARFITWNDVSLARGETVYLSIPTYSQDHIRSGYPGGSDLAYQLTRGNAVLTSTRDIKSGSFNANYAIISSTPSNSYGYTWGDSCYVYGSNVVLHAMPYQNGRFAGWYEDSGSGTPTGSLLSTQTDYTFPLTSTGTPFKYVAKFGFNAVPQNVEVKMIVSGSEKFPCVTWERPASDYASPSDISQYKVYRNGTYLGGVDADMPVLQYVDSTAQVGQTYTYTVTAVTNKIAEESESEHSAPATIVCGVPTPASKALAHGRVNEAYSDVLTTDTDVTGFAIIGGALPAGLSLNPSTGAITGIPGQAGTKDFTIRLSNSFGYADVEYAISIEGTTGAPIIVTGDFEEVVSSATDQTLALDALPTGGSSPDAQWAIVGDLPADLSINPMGQITVASNVSGVYEIKLRAANALGADERTIKIVVRRSDNAPVISTVQSEIKAGKLGQAYSSALQAVGAGPLYWHLTNNTQLPEGLSLDINTGVISGTPLRAGSYYFIVACESVLGIQERGFIINISGSGSDNPHGYITYTYEDWLRDQQSSDMAPSSGLQPDVPPDEEGVITAHGNNPDKFWDSLRAAANSSERGAALRANAKTFDKMPPDIMSLLQSMGLTLELSWEWGETIIITPENALTPEVGREYYPLSYLVELLNEAEVPVVAASGLDIPQTGDDFSPALLVLALTILLFSCARFFKREK